MPGNPGGRYGSPEHRRKVAERAKQLETEGYEITGGGGRLPERAVTTLEGKRRYPDISAKDPFGRSYYENVGRTTKSGEPVARERKALADINRATGTESGFTAYDRSGDN